MNLAPFYKTRNYALVKFEVFQLPHSEKEITYDDEVRVYILQLGAQMMLHQITVAALLSDWEDCIIFCWKSK